MNDGERGQLWVLQLTQPVGHALALFQCNMMGGYPTRRIVYLSVHQCHILGSHKEDALRSLVSQTLDSPERTRY